MMRKRARNAYGFLPDLKANAERLHCKILMKDGIPLVPVEELPAVTPPPTDTQLKVARAFDQIEASRGLRTSGRVGGNIFQFASGSLFARQKAKLPGRRPSPFPKLDPVPR